jgi:uncharacterized protein YvpB
MYLTLDYAKKLYFSSHPGYTNLYMSYRDKKSHIHPFHAYTFIGVTLFFVIWLIGSANPNKVQAEDDVDLSQILNAKDTATKVELEKPDVVLPLENSEPEDVSEYIPVVPVNKENLSVNILPKGKHQRTQSVITIIASTELDPISVEKSFTIIPNVPGTFSVNGRVATFKPDAILAPQTKYTINLTTQLHGKGGQFLLENITQSFETEPNLKILSVPYYRQQFSRSCEAASLRMALAYKGTVTNDMEIINAAGYNPREPDWVNKIWDDPYEMFVGYIDAPKVGYGIYAQALAKAAKEFGHETKVLINPSVKQIASEVIAGNPVVMWGYINDTVPKLSYFNTESGKRIPIYSNEHARTITGVVGSEHDPVGFYVHDPLSGTANEYWTVEKLQKHMSIFGAVSNQVLVVK